MPAIMGSTASATRLLLERDTELATGREAIDRTGAGVGGALVLEGAAGLGKTELVRALLALGSEGGMQCHAARCDDLERDFPYGVVRQLFEQTVSQAPDDVRTSLLEGAAATAAAILGPASSADSSFTALHGLYWLTSNLAERAPLLLAVDDVHWADPPSLRFLHFLSRRLGELPVLLLLARRPMEPFAEPDLVGRIGSAPGASVLRLAPLSEAAAAELVRALLGGDAEEPFCRACHTATRGNPFLLRELAVALREEGIPPTGTAAARVGQIAPEGISRQVLLRLERVGPDALALARSAAVLGSGVPLRHAATVAELDAAAAAQAADRLVGADVLARAQPLEFAHPVVREVIYTDIPPGERALAHARAAHALSEAGAPADHTATQLLAAEPAGRRWAVEVLRAAAREALRRGEPSAAAVLLERALAEGSSAEPDPELSRELGRAKALAGDADADEHLRAALQTAPPGPQRAQIASELAHAQLPLGRFDEAVDTLEAAVDQLGEEDRELSLRLEAEISITGRLHPTTYARTATRLKRVGESVDGATPAERLLLASLATERMIEGRHPAPEVAALLERAWAGGLLGEETSASPMLYDVLYAAVCTEAFPLAEQICDETVEDARARGSLLGITGSLCFRSNLAYRRGSIAEAGSDADMAVETAEMGGYAWAPMALALLIDALRERGELEAAKSALEAKGFTAELPPYIMANFLVLSRGRLRIATGDVEGGIADFRDLARRTERAPVCHPSAFPWRSSLAVALAQLGQPSEARSLAAEEFALAQEWGTPRAIGMALRALGIAEGGRGGLDHLRESVATLDGSHAALELARGLVDLGAALRRDNQRREARDPLRRGLDLAIRCGATALAEHARVELLATGARPRRLALAGVDALTPSELRVARLAADGLTNREIAQTLFNSVRTVQVHLTHTYQKLEISGREGLADALARERAV